MALSRLRLRLGVAFSLAFGFGLALLAAVALGYLWRESHRRLDNRIERLASDVVVNLGLESRETPDSGSAFIAGEVVAEWPRNGGSYLICTSSTPAYVATDSSRIAAQLGTRCGDTTSRRFDATDDEGNQVRAFSRRVTIGTPAGVRRPTSHTFGIVTFASTAGISEDTELLLAAIAIAAPVILLVSLTGGYLMAKRALRPVTQLGTAISSIAPTDLSYRLPIREPRDEVGTLAAEFNALLARLNFVQSQNRKFLREAAHQIRTPLTLVLGEAAYELETANASPERMRGSLKRIGLAAERMRRRVDELFVLAEAQTGEPVALRDLVELDGLVLDAVDLMRPRSTALGRALAIGVAEHVVVRGNQPLLQEALLELLENALRHGTALQPVTISVGYDGTTGSLDVSSGGSPFSLPFRAEHPGPHRLGLPIVQWIADVHGGSLVVHCDGVLNVVRLQLPSLPGAVNRQPL